jgi:murein DD-endopeptidase MepM/ murein hydrolase activator NlpD
MRHLARLRLGTPAIIAVVIGGVALAPTPGSSTDPSPADQPPLPEFHLVAAEPIARQPWLVPVSGYRLTGRFGDVSGYWASAHTGLDFATSTGTPIHSIATGVVVTTAYDGAYGNKTVVRLPDGTEVWYCHQDTQSVVAGQTVTRGQVIGTVGSTGNTTGPHLHLEIRPGGGDPVDPELALRRHRVEP